jgi:hypothetical protein
MALRRRAGIVANPEFGTVPGQQRISKGSCAAPGTRIDIVRLSYKEVTSG